MHYHVLTSDTLNVIVGGRYFSCPRTGLAFAKVKEGIINDEDAEYFERLLAPLGSVADSLKDTAADIEITHNSVLYNGAPVHAVLVAKILDVISEGFPADPWVAFVRNLYSNPDIASREEIFLFMDGAELPLTEDGCIIAYKKVTYDYKDLHTGVFDNSIGQVVTVPRESVDKDRRNLCSSGLHFCSKGYLPHFGYGNSRVVLVKVNPADIVSIPADYNNAKGRTWKYEVVGELTQEEIDTVRWPAAVQSDGSFFGRDDDEQHDEYEDDWWSDDDYDDESGWTL